MQLIIKDETNHNYIIGFGNDELNNNLDENLFAIAKLISKKISIEICYDIQKNIKAKSFEFFQLTDYNCMEIEQLKNITKCRRLF